MSWPDLVFTNEIGRPVNATGMVKTRLSRLYESSSERTTQRRITALRVEIATMRTVVETLARLDCLEGADVRCLFCGVLHWDSRNLPHTPDRIVTTARLLWQAD